jgi:lipoprotein-anchoring transpeptidase ErfK/SrfK
MALRLLGAIALVIEAHLSSALAQTVEITAAHTERNAAAVRLEISRSRHRATLFRGESPIAAYSIATGRPGWETPLGEFHVRKMLRDPAWEHPLTGEIFQAGARGNELGHYWIGFAGENGNEIGFHGTPHAQTVGKSLSHGCLRMYDKDIEALFRRVSVGTVVSVVP